MPQFDVAAAKQAGYSEDEILSHLTSTRKFDVQGALQSGYSKEEVIQHLAGAPKEMGGDPTGKAKVATVGDVIRNIPGQVMERSKELYNRLQQPEIGPDGKPIQINELWIGPVASMASPAAGGAVWQGAREIPAMIKAAPEIKAITSIVNRFRKVPEIAKEITDIETKLAPSGGARVRMAKDVAPELAKDPGLVTAKTTEQFDKALFAKHQANGEAVRAIEAAIPDQTPVQVKPVLDKWQDLIDRYYEMGADDAVTALKRQGETLGRASKTETIPWKQFIENKRRMGNDLRKAGVFKRLVDGTATEKDYALSQAYGHLMEASSGVSTDLAAANKAFSISDDAVKAAGIDARDGRRLSTVGKPVVSKGRQLAKSAIKAGALGTAAAAGARIYYSVVD